MATPGSRPDESTDRLSRFAIPRSDWPRILLIAVVLPLLLTSVNRVIAGGLFVTMPTANLVGIFAVYVGEMALIAVAAGAGIRQTWLAWLLLVWLVLMIDLHLFVAAVGQGNTWRGQNDLPVVAFAAAQLGFLIVWAAIGGEKWYQRLPVALVAAGLVLAWWRQVADMWRYDRWTTILMIEMAGIGCLSIVLRLTGFRLHRWGHPGVGSAGSRVQFGLRHVLVFITVLAVLLGIARAAQMLTLPFFLETVRTLKLWRLAIGCPSAMLVVLAFWAALGKGSALLRTAVISVGCLAVGLGMAGWSVHMLQTAVPRAGTLGMELWERMRFWEVRYWWIAWYGLSTGLLAACLLFFRARGYRIFRMRRNQSTA